MNGHYSLWKNLMQKKSKESEEIITMIIDNVKVYTESGEFILGGIITQGDTITAVYSEREKEVTFEKMNMTADSSVQKEKLTENVIDGKGAYAIPGLIDLHFHGCMGDDFCDGDKEAIRRIAEYEASVGVTAIAPATMTLPVEELESILKTAAEYKKECENINQIETKNDKKRADFVGINMEGPFISPIKKGAQDERNIIPCNEEIAQRFLDASDHLVKFLGIAPEESANAASFIKNMKDKVNISLAHTNASYETAKEALEAGANHVVHLFNAMTGFTHREPGVVGATFDTDITTETISDGIHISYPSLRIAYKQKGTDKTLLVTDAMCACGMPDGKYALGGQPVIVKNGAARLENGALAGSVLTLNKAIKNIYENTDYPLYEIIKMASYNGAKYCKVDNKKGQIKENFDADLVVFDENIDIKITIIGGKVVYSN